MMTEPFDISTSRQLFVDRVLIDQLENAVLRLHEPVSGGTAIRIDRPWEGPVNGGSVVIQRGKMYWMYYRAMTLSPGDDTGALCVATSADGLTWTKPSLGLVERAGRRDTNIVADTAGNPLMVVPWLDTRPGVPEGERIKAIHSEPCSGEKHTAFADPKGPKRLVFWASPDGFSFRKLDPQPRLVSALPNCFDGGNTLFWSEAEQQYVLYYRYCDVYDGAKSVFRRSIARTTSKDLIDWTESVPMTYGDTPREQFYTNNTTPYFRAPHHYIAPAARFMERRRVVTDAQVQAIGLKSSHGYFFGNDCSDAVLLTARAGATQYDRTFMEAFIRPGLGASNWVSRTNYPLTGIFPCGADQLMLFVSRHYMQDSWHIERMLLRTDGFVSVAAPWVGGELVTRPFIFAGDRLEINYRTSAAGSIRIELQNAEGNALPGLALDDGAEIIGDEIERVVAWKQGIEVGSLAGRPVRLRMAMRDADVFSFRFSNSRETT